ncbi:hypothetical protein FHR92_001039 [Fontibacillus solani]|uniref:Uncharacterized protein n=1 Tax=Fontibacillus solani TaxID=1572857 RepID=A0A7W3SQW5_9BACL|nr:hypothetical protein [Fontibacillus solani]MBA9084582.1 hypothetical protein [Fontibacillus solani]
MLANSITTYYQEVDDTLGSIKSKMQRLANEGSKRDISFARRMAIRDELTRLRRRIKALKVSSI